MDTPTRSRAGRLATGAGLLAAGALAGAVVAGTLSATATTDEAPSVSTDATDIEGTEPRDMHGPDPVRDDEESVAADLASQLEAAAVQEVPDGTVYRVETDAGDAAYEAHMSTPDGDVIVKFDENLAVVEVQEGMGTGDPGGHPGGHRGPDSSTADDAAASETSSA